MRPFGGAVKTSHVIRQAHTYLIFQTMSTPLTSGFPRMKRQLFFSWMFIHADSGISGYGTLHIPIVPEQQETEKRVANVHNQEWGFEVVLANGRLDRKHFQVEK